MIDRLRARTGAKIVLSSAHVFRASDVIEKKTLIIMIMYQLSFMESDAIDSGDDNISEVSIDCGERHIGKNMAPTMRTIRHNEAEKASLLSVCVALRRSATLSGINEAPFERQAHE